MAYSAKRELKPRRRHLGIDRDTAVRASRLFETAWEKASARYEAFLDEPLPAAVVMALGADAGAVWRDLDEPPPLHCLPEAMPIAEAARRGEQVVKHPAVHRPAADTLWRAAVGIAADTMGRYFVVRPQDYVRTLDR